MLCKLSKDNASGYLNVNKLRNSKKGPIWQAKFVPDGVSEFTGMNVLDCISSSVSIFNILTNH